MCGTNMVNDRSLRVPYTEHRRKGGAVQHDDQAGRRQIHVKVCPVAWNAWEMFARKQGVSMAALIDAIGHQLAEAKPGPLQSAAVNEAREIDANRRRRG